MASWIFMGCIRGDMGKMTDFRYKLAMHSPFRFTGNQVVIAKGNRIEGIEAKE